MNPALASLLLVPTALACESGSAQEPESTQLPADEPLEPPLLSSAIPDRPQDGRPVINVRWDGRISAGREKKLYAGVILNDREVLYDPRLGASLEDPYAGVKQWLALTAQRMEKASHGGAGSSLLLPDEPVLIRPDRSAPFVQVQRLMEICATQEVQIWKIQLSFLTTEGAPGLVCAYLPLDIGIPPPDAEPIERVEVLLRVGKDAATGAQQVGAKLRPGPPPAPYTSSDEAAEPPPRFLWNTPGLIALWPDLNSLPVRRLEYSVGPYRTEDLEVLEEKLQQLHASMTRSMPIDPDTGARMDVPVTIDARAGTCYEDIAPVLDALLSAGFLEITFLAAPRFETPVK